MNDEYLWEKTGKDPEIEKLEKALAVFRYRDASSPAAAPDKAVAVERRPRLRLSLAFAFASVAIFAIIAAVWVSRSADVTEEIVFVNETEIPAEPTPAVPAPATPEIRTSEPPSRRGISPRRKVNPTTASSTRPPKKKDGAPKDNIASLTDEERYAYRQLILALAITGSNLKIVRDAIDGTGQRSNDTDRNQR